jgi:hypothetical protein
MAHHNQFVIRNDLSRPLILNIEPEGAFFPLGRGEEVSVFDAFTTAPVTVKLTNSDRGEPILSIWPGDGEVRVEKNGVDVLDLLQKGVGV